MLSYILLAVLAGQIAATLAQNTTPVTNTTAPNTTAPATPGPAPGPPPNLGTYLTGGTSKGLPPLELGPSTTAVTASSTSTAYATSTTALAAATGTGTGSTTTASAVQSDSHGLHGPTAAYIITFLMLLMAILALL
jgi:hypothetical protein